MKDFMNNLYQNGEGKTVTGRYRGEDFIGTITNVRCCYGGGLNVYVDLEQPIVIAGRERESLVLDGEELANGGGADLPGRVAENLHVYF